jgi:adiponectin receptor
MASNPRFRVPPREPETSKRRAMEDDTSRSRSGQAGRPALLSFNDMPQWFQDDNNKWILHGYRPISGSTRASFRSWWYLHNETLNIYSHLIPAIIFLFGEWYLLQYLASRYSQVNSADFLAFSSFMITATTCYAFSALYHTLMNHSYTVDHFWHRLDMLGIGIFIVGDIILGVYLIFWCETTLRNIYWSLVSYSLYAQLFCPRTGIRV